MPITPKNAKIEEETERLQSHDLPDFPELPNPLRETKGMEEYHSRIRDWEFDFKNALLEKWGNSETTTETVVQQVISSSPSQGGSSSPLPHNHDDLYYREGEVDALLAALSASFAAAISALEDSIDQRFALTRLLVNQPGHPFTAKGEPVASDSSSGEFVKPTWSSDPKLWGVFIVDEVVDDDNFYILGLFQTGLSGITPHAVYYVKPDGTWTTDEADATPVENPMRLGITSDTVAILPYPAAYSPTTDNLVTLDEPNSADSDVLYIGRAKSGSLESESKWQIRRVDLGELDEDYWADSDQNFDNVWDDRETLTYGVLS